MKLDLLLYFNDSKKFIVNKINKLLDRANDTPLLAIEYTIAYKLRFTNSVFIVQNIYH